MLFNQFHDILPGSSIESAYTDVIAWHGEARMIAREAINGAEQSLGANINTSVKQGIPIIVWNPHGFEVNGPAEVELNVREGDMPFHLGPVFDSTGKQIPCQFTPSECKTGGEDRQRMIVYTTVPAMGYKTLWLQADPNPVKAASSLSVKEETGRVVMENSHVKAVIDKNTGYITGLEYKDTGAVIVNQPTAVPVAIEDSSDTWSHDIMAFKKVIGKFGNATVTIKENGPVRVCVEVKSVYNKSEFVQEFMLYNNEARIEVRASVDWHEKLTMFKMQFALNASDPRSFYSIPFGFIEAETRWQRESRRPLSGYPG